jgi:hypothetical protein
MAMCRRGVFHRCALAALFLLTAASRLEAAPWPPPVASYDIEVRYDPLAHSVSGRQTITWRNNTTRATRELQFHLYQNAFANSRSSFMREIGDAWVDWAEKFEDPWGYTEISSLRVGGAERAGEAHFIQPDDANADDRTVLAVPLERPVRSGEAVAIEIEFVTKLPRPLARSGHSGPYAFFAQWFPKLGVLEESGWDCRQYHHTTEFYADFGTYEVTVEVPADSVVGATGLLAEDRHNQDGSRRLRFVAEGVHDFAWAVDPRFVEVKEQIADIEVRLLVQPGHVHQARRYIDAARAAIERYGQWIGPYPYKTLTMVDPAPGAFATGGMEYPTLITLATTWWMPAGVRVPEVVTVHEFGHQYWYGMVASNEFEEAWLDEGVNSYLEAKIMDDAYGPASYVDLFGLQIDSLADYRGAYLRATSRDPLARAAWQFFNRRSYAAISYAKTMLVLDTLARVHGEDAVKKALADYFNVWKFRRPEGRDLLDSLGRSVGKDLTAYFQQVVYGTGVVDYAITAADSRELPALTGHPFQGVRAGEAVKPEPEEPPRYENEVVVERLGEVVLPLRVDVRFDDGTTATEYWDGVDRWRRFEYVGTQRVEWAVADPEGALSLDVNRLNNSRMREAGTRGIVRLASRWGFWFQSLLHVLTGL